MCPVFLCKSCTIYVHSNFNKSQKKRPYQQHPVLALRSFKVVVELRGFEPLTFALPARRSSQLSYSPKKDKYRMFIN
jgi:hypothetical protein